MRPARKNPPEPKQHKYLTLDEFRPVLMVLVLLIWIQMSVAADRTAAREPVTLSNAPSYSSDFEDRKSYFIDTLVEFEDRIYILPNSGQGFVQVYDLLGTYQYSMFFLEHRNGGFFLGTDGEYLYVKDKRSNVFVFQNGQFLRYEKREHAEKRPAGLWQSTPGYEIRGRDLWRVSDDREALIIENLTASAAEDYDSIVLRYILPTGLLWIVGSWIKRRRLKK